MTLGIYVTWIGRFFLLIMIEKETGTLEDSRFKFYRTTTLYVHGSSSRCPLS